MCEFIFCLVRKLCCDHMVRYGSGNGGKKELKEMYYSGI